MKTIAHTFLLLLGLATFAHAQFPDHVNVIDVKMNSTSTIKGDLSTGRFVDLRFGVRGSVDCFTEKEKFQYNGKHVFYSFEVPAGTKMVVSMTGNDDFSLYGYMIDAKRYDTPPYVENVSKFGCSSSHKSEGGKEQIILAAGSVPMNVVLAVAGVNERANGGFTLKVTTKK